jgi:hypothetical protein
LWRVDAERGISPEAIRRYHELGGQLHLRPMRARLCPVRIVIVVRTAARCVYA